MRLFIALILGTFLVVVSGQTNLFATNVILPPQDDYADYMWEVHHHEQPLPTDILTQAPTEDDTVTAEMVTYGTLDGKEIKGYLASPMDIDRPLPGIIVIHEWWGLNDNIKAMTRKLAAEGYTALAVDMYSGETAETPEKARELVTEARNNSDRLKDNLALAYQYLEEEEKAPKIASIGWCFGGSLSLQTALLFPETLDAAVIYYGGDLETDAEVLKPLEMPILGIFGELDDRPSPETVEAFEMALKSLDKEVDVYIYPNADHAFANPSGERYNPVAAMDAWDKTVAFFSEHLK
ncbi:dienelactone hydrolase [Crocosphaera subtropica ATCC 51142]|uniref:Dienelactone hydrolase n=1 Tax=Crocosphaera subtropica (strain ATCC 51142 / BH68) TaxID=43989 RepID=B1WXH9_CROS5|nr:dienelactone hydrolase family protein [Crocosphaera subtropica]ACB52520.1 dienelactone hydrolase [Crocosphaera subtropica ATCC 51142]